MSEKILRPHSPTDGSTSTSLLAKVRARDPEAWERLVAAYGPLVYRWCRQAGLQAEDAADVLQETFRSALTGIDGFHKTRPTDSFRAWLRTVTRTRVADHFRRAATQPQATGGDSAQRRLAEVPEPLFDESVFDAPVDRLLVIRRLLDVLQTEFNPATWQAFWRVTVANEATDSVARALNLSVPAVRQANYRVRRRLREELGDLGE
jgi:RNA polymerase sigma-70 factor, ECF subfamily